MPDRRQQPTPTADGHGQRLSAIDSSFLRLESGRAHMHIGWSAVFTPADGAPRPTLSGLRARAGARLHWVPRCRQRLQPSPLGPVGEPRWVDDPHFDIAEHVVALSGPDDALSPERFARLRDGVLSTPLDRARPLWQVALVPRLQDGRIGVIGRVHHAMADGTAALLLATLLLDTGTDETGGEDARPWTPRTAPGAARWAADPLLDGAAFAGSVLRGAAGTLRRPRRSVRAGLRQGARVALALREDTLPRAAPSSLNHANGPRRTLVGCRIPLMDLRAARAHGGGTLNDIALALTAGALRGLAQTRGEHPLALKAMIPVSVRRGEEHAELGNRISQVMVWLPLHLSAPRERLDHVREQTERFKRTERPEGHRTLLAGLAHVHGPARDLLLRAAASPRSYNLVLSNVRGPRAALHLFGARLEELYPVVPIGHGHAMAIGMVSHGAHLHLGLHADPDALPEVTRLPDLLAREVRALAGGAPPPPPGGRRGGPAGRDRGPRIRPAIRTASPAAGRP